MTALNCTCRAEHWEWHKEGCPMYAQEQSKRQGLLASKEQLTVDQAVGMLLKTAGYVLSTEKADKLVAYIQELDRLAFPAETKAEWQPIFTAPKDRPLLLWSDDPFFDNRKTRYFVGTWTGQYGEWGFPGTGGLRAKYWRDLPESPEKSNCESSASSVAVVHPTEPSPEGSGAAAGGAVLCPSCKTELAFEGDVCGLCFPVAQP